MQYGNILQEGLNSLIPLTQTIYKNYQMFSKNYFLFRGVPRDCHLTVYGQNHAKINFDNVHYAILYKYMSILYKQINTWKNIEFNAILGAPRPWSYFLYIYFSNAHPLIYVIN